MGSHSAPPWCGWPPRALPCFQALLPVALTQTSIGVREGRGGEMKRWPHLDPAVLEPQLVFLVGWPRLTSPATPPPSSVGQPWYCSCCGRHLWQFWTEAPLLDLLLSFFQDFSWLLAHQSHFSKPSYNFFLYSCCFPSFLPFLGLEAAKGSWWVCWVCLLELETTLFFTQKLINYFSLPTFPVVFFFFFIWKILSIKKRERERKPLNDSCWHTWRCGFALGSVCNRCFQQLCHCSQFASSIHNLFLSSVGIPEHEINIV